jgi:hypothetical protein
VYKYCITYIRTSSMQHIVDTVYTCMYTGISMRGGEQRVRTVMLEYLTQQPQKQIQQIQWELELFFDASCSVRQQTASMSNPASVSFPNINEWPQAAVQPILQSMVRCLSMFGASLVLRHAQLGVPPGFWCYSSH